MKKIYAAYFTIIILSFSGFMLVMSLLSAIDLTSVRDSQQRYEKEIARLEEENHRLCISYEQSISVEELEEFALQELGMQRCRPEQIVYLQIQQEKILG